MGERKCLVQIKRVKKGFVLNESFSIRQRMEYFLQVNDLYKVEEQRSSGDGDAEVLCWRKI